MKVFVEWEVQYEGMVYDDGSTRQSCGADPTKGRYLGVNSYEMVASSGDGVIGGSVVA